jgi:hypothetical protein
MGAVGVKCGDTVGGTAGASEMPNCSGMASGMAEATGIVEDCAEMAECHMELLRPLEFMRLLK